MLRLMQVRLLGPVEVLSDGNPVPLGGRQRRTLLSILAVHAGEAVSTDRLIDELWGDSRPDTARKTVQSHIAHLRKALNTHSEVLAPARDGYAMRIDADSIDTNQFESLVKQARERRRAAPMPEAKMLSEMMIRVVLLSAMPPFSGGMAGSRLRDGCQPAATSEPPGQGDF